MRFMGIAFFYAKATPGLCCAAIVGIAPHADERLSPRAHSEEIIDCEHMRLTGRNFGHICEVRDA